MPELPEVETVRIGLNRLIIGKVIDDVEYNWDKSFPNAKDDVEAFVIGAKITNVRRRAKVLLIDLSTEYSLVIHLKMTGQLVFVLQQKPQALRTNIETLNKSEIRFGAGHPNDSLVGALPDKSTRVVFTFSDSSQLFFNDQRKFGWIKLIKSSAVQNIAFIKNLGPEPLDNNFTQTQFRDRLLKRPNTNVKAALLDQSVIAGVGNIYADESLWGARIHPTTLVKNISLQQMNTLYSELLYVLNLAIQKGGSSDKNYVNAEGKKGSYLSFARVFRREGLTCPRCGSVIIKTRVASRGTHTCPRCQSI